MKISVALCTYNGQAYLREQLASILAQSQLPDEMVVSDDASSDATVSILQHFASQAPFPVRIYINQQNIGISNNFNCAIEHCLGDVIALSDQDDVWLPHKLETLVNTLTINPQAGYVFSDAMVMNHDLKPFALSEASLWQRVGFTPADIEMFSTGDSIWQVQRLLKRTLVTGTTLAFRSALRQFVMPISSAWVHDAWISLLLSAFGWHGVPINQPLVQYRQHAAQHLGVRSGLAIHSPQVSNFTKFNIFRKMTKRDKLNKRAQSLEAIQALTQYLAVHRQLGVKPVSDNILTVLQSHTQHMQSRISAYESSGAQRLRIILKSLISGGYHIHSNRYVSVIQDTLC